VVALEADYLNAPDFAFVMPLADCHLYDFVEKRNNTLDLAQRCKVFDNIINGITQAHNQGILHRDIAPHNVLMFGDEPALSDFGLGKNLHELQGLTNSSAAGYGHAHYVAPEQLTGLKSATVQSDVYSMGKLLNFVVTGKTPDRLYPCEFSPLIRRSTESDVQKRMQSMAEFSKLYEATKRLYFEPIPVDASTVESIAASGETVAWDVWHRAAVEGRFSGHPYYGYLKPVMDYLSEDIRLTAYADSVEADLIAFASKFESVLDECIGSLGWPFSKSTAFAEFLRRLNAATTQIEVQTMCIRSVWDLAYPSDQWGAQAVARKMFNKGEVSDEALPELAGHILQSDFAIDLSRFSDVDFPNVIQKAVSHAAGSNDS